MPPYNAPAWKPLIKKLASDAKFSRPAKPAQFASVEQSLGVELPSQLKEILSEADGVTADYSSGVVWSLADIQKRNQEFRTTEAFKELYMPFSQLLFFGDDGGGDHFAYAIHADGQIHNQDIFRWDHENDSRSWFAGRMEQFFENRLKKESEDDDG